jgi:hypothetical protein
MIRTTLPAAAGLLLLAGCADFPGDAQSTGSVSFESLVRQIKYDVGGYLLAHQNDVPVVEAPGADADRTEKSTYQANQKAGLARPPAASEKCLGQVSFDIAKVKITASAEVENKAGGSVGLQVPINVATLNLSGGVSQSRKGSLTTTLEIYPTDQLITEPPRPVPEFQGRPIADTLEAVRTDLIKTADTQPCFDFGRSEDQKANSIKWGFTVVRSTRA